MKERDITCQSPAEVISRLVPRVSEVLLNLDKARSLIGGNGYIIKIDRYEKLGVAQDKFVFCPLCIELGVCEKFRFFAHLHAVDCLGLSRVIHIMFLLAVGFSLLGCGSAPLLTNDGHVINTQLGPIKTWKEIQQINIEMQALDYSCGAASLATLMRHYFNENVTEQSLLDDIEQLFSDAEMEQIEQLGLSFLELEKVSKARGYQTASVRLSLSALRELAGPVLVYIKPDGYNHFAILRGIVEDRVFLADPSRGNIRMSVHEFRKEWAGETFIIGKEGFGLPQQHNLTINLKPRFRNELSILRESIRITKSATGRL